MNILEAIAGAQQTKPESVLVARPPLTWGAEAMYVALTDDYRLPKHIQDAGFQYLLGVEEILSMLEFLQQKKISDRSVAEFIIHYAINDSPPAWIDDVPDI